MHLGIRCLVPHQSITRKGRRRYINITAPNGRALALMAKGGSDSDSITDCLPISPVRIALECEVYCVYHNTPPSHASKRRRKQRRYLRLDAAGPISSRNLLTERGSVQRTNTRSIMPPGVVRHRPHTTPVGIIGRRRRSAPRDKLDVVSSMQYHGRLQRQFSTTTHCIRCTGCVLAVNDDGPHAHTHTRARWTTGR